MDMFLDIAKVVSESFHRLTGLEETIDDIRSSNAAVRYELGAFKDYTSANLIMVQQRLT